MSKWKMVKLGEVCEILDSMRVPVTASDRKAGIYPYYGANGIQDYVDSYIFDDELVLLAEDGGNFGSKEKPVAYRVSGKCWVNNHAHVLKPKDILDVDYLCYSIMFYDVSKLISGTTRAKLNQAAVRKIEIPLPPFDIQKHIADTLNKTQEIIDGHKKQLEELDNLIKATFYDMFGDPVLNNKNWEKVLLKEILSDIRYGASTPPVFAETGYKFIRATNIKNGRIIDEDMKFITEDEGKKIEKCKMHGNEMIIVRSGVNSGDTCIITEEYIGNYAGYDLILEYNQEKVSPMFANELFNTNYMENVIKPFTRRAAQPHLNSDQVKSLQIILPPLKLQKQYITIVHNIEEQKSLVKQSITESQNLFNSLMSKYFD